MSIDEGTTRELLERIAEHAPMPPEWTSDLRRRTVRRRHRLRAGAVLATVAVLAGTAAIGFGVSGANGSGAQRLATSGPGVPTGRALQRLAGDATKLAVVFAHSWSTEDREGLYVRNATTLVTDLRTLGSGANLGWYPRGAGYLIEVRGHFTCPGCTSDPDHSPHPTVLLGWVPTAGRHRVYFYGATATDRDLSLLGTAFAIPDPPNVPTLLSVKLLALDGTHPNHGLAGTVQARNGTGDLITTIQVPADGHASVKVPPGSTYTLTGFHLDGTSCRQPDHPNFGTEQVPVIGGLPTLATVYCPT
jgi:hypothetical protein